MSTVEGNFSRVKGKMSRVQTRHWFIHYLFYYFVSSWAYLFFFFLWRGSRINTDQFPKPECKLLGGPGYAPLSKVPFPGFPSHSDRTLASSIVLGWSHANRRIISWSRLISMLYVGYGARLQLGKFFLLLKIKTLETCVDPRLFLELTSMPGWLSTFAYKTLSLMYMCGYFASPYE